MLQQNNNNNCLDMAHRELLHECRRTNVSLTSALEFGAIPLIKGLRAWAVNGGYSKARRKAANGSRAQSTCQQPPENRVAQRSWSGQVRSGYGHTLDSANSAARPPGVRQGGLGALVTVATLKGTEGGGRQTQTRCLFLKAQGQGSYICAVGNRGAGARVTGPRSHTVILEGAKEELTCSSRGQRVNHDGVDDGGLFKAKPRAIRKWRKCSKTTASAEKRTKAHGKEEIGNKRCELEHGDRKNAVITDAQALSVTPGDTITQCQKGTSASNPREEDINELGKDKRAHSSERMKTVAPESMDQQTCCSSDKPCAKPNEEVEAEMSINQSNNCSEIDEGSSCANADAQGDTKVGKRDLASNDLQNIHSFVADVPNLGTPEANFESLEIKSATTNCSNEPSIDHSSFKSHSEVPVSIQETRESRPDECLERENLHSVESRDLTAQRDGPPDSKNTVMPEGVECSTTEKKWRPPQHWEELITEHGELEVQQSDKSSSRGFSTPTANITVTTIHSQPNPAPTTTAAIATAIPALSNGEVGARGGDFGPPVNSELPSDPARVDDRDKVATDEGSLDVGEEEDEFGAFMQAGGEHLWMDGFSEVQQLAEGHDYNCEGCTDANEPASWASDWTADQSFQPSERTWVAFGQETVEQKIVPGGQWWPSTEKPNLSLSPLHNVSNVFLEAFPSDTSPCEDPEYIPTLKQLLQEPAENSNRGERKEQSLLDGLQDLDRMIGVKYKRAESLSCKLLLQALRLERPSSERVTVRLKASARFSPNLPTSNQQLAANAKRRLSYDFNRNIVT